MPEQQIAFVDATSWVIRGPFFSQSGLYAHHRLPPVCCPVVDTTLAQDRQALAQILGRAITPEGVKDLEALLSDLNALGCQVSMPAELPQLAALAELE
jgi:hypothetical protein